MTPVLRRQPGSGTGRLGWRRAALFGALLLGLAALGGDHMVGTGAAFASTTANGPSSLALATLAPPTGLAADRSTPGQVVLTWTATASSFATGYTVLRSTVSGCCYTGYATVSGRNTTTWTDTSANAAITYVSQSTALQSTDLTSMTLSVPTGVTAGDLLVAHLAVAQSATVTAPSGWTLQASGTAFGNVSSAALYRVAGASEPASYTFTWTGAHESAGAMLAYRNVDTSSPVLTWASATGSSSSPTAPSVTTTAPNAMVLRLMAAEKTNLPSPTSGTYPSGTTGRYAQQAAGPDPVTGAGAEKAQATAGASGTAAFTLVATSDWMAMTVALRPASLFYVLQATYLSWSSVSSAEV